MQETIPSPLCSDTLESLLASTQIYLKIFNQTH